MSSAIPGEEDAVRAAIGILAHGVLSLRMGRVASRPSMPGI
jgi:hypothetical protein